MAKTVKPIVQGMNNLDLDNKIYDYLRNQHPNFVFGIRTRSNTDRFKAGYKFNGADHYISIGLVKTSGGVTQGKAIHLYFENSKCNLGIFLDQVNDAKIRSCYQGIANNLNGSTFTKGRFIKSYGTINDINDVYNCINSFINNDYNIISSMIMVDSYCKNQIWTANEFSNMINKAQQERNNKGIGGKKDSYKLPLNLILYGPPGTGKTYNTVNEALTILEPDWETNFNNQKSSGESDKRKYALSRFNHYKDKGQIVFTTFHQSLSYEEFIEGIKPIPGTEDIVATHNNAVSPTPGATQFGEGTTTFENLKMMQYEVRPGIFKQLCEKAKANKTTLVTHTFPSHTGSSATSGTPTFDDFWNALIKEIEKDLNAGNEVLYPSKTNAPQIVKGISDDKEKIIFDNQNDVTKEKVKKLLNGFPGFETLKNFNKEFQKCVGGMNATRYWAIMKRLKEIENEWEECHNRETQPDTQTTERTENTMPIDSTKPYVLIIDEINRGNVSQIFGELITLIEEDKRLGNKEEMTVKLPYSSSVDSDAEPFGVPNNLYIIGTMNTADRSVEALDTALRRRFEFKEMMPDSHIKNENGDDLFYKREICEIKLGELMDTINNRIRVLKDREHQIGHSYFMNCNTEPELKNTFKNKIVPLLQEYFYGNYAYIGLVLGKGFVKIDEKATEVQFADFDIDETPEKDKKYRLLAENEWDGLSMEEAVNKLMGEKKEEKQKQE